jgi:hypothetical protein
MKTIQYFESFEELAEFLKLSTSDLLKYLSGDDYDYFIITEGTYHSDRFHIFDRLLTGCCTNEIVTIGEWIVGGAYHA